jgi:hypothetical protein
VNYRREIKKQLLVYQLTIAFLLVGSLTIAAFKAYVYFAFIAVAYFIRDFVFAVYFVSITETALTVKRIFLGGLFARKFSVDRNRIIEVANIDTGVTTDSEIDFEFGIFSSGDGTNKKKFELYRIKQLDRTDSETTIKLPLTQVEANILSEQLAPTTLVDKTGPTNKG